MPAANYDASKLFIPKKASDPEGDFGVNWRVLERWANNLPSSTIWFPPFTFPGVVATDTTSCSYFPPEAVHLSEIFVYLRTRTVGGDTEINYPTTTDPFGIVTLAAADTFDTFPIDVDLALGDFIAVATTSVLAPGAADLTVQFTAEPL